MNLSTLPVDMDTPRQIYLMDYYFLFSYLFLLFFSLATLSVKSCHLVVVEKRLLVCQICSEIII